MLTGKIRQSAQADRSASPATVPSSTAFTSEVTAIDDIDPTDHETLIPDNDLSSQAKNMGQPATEEIQQPPEPLRSKSEVGDFRPSPLTSTIEHPTTQWLSDTLVLSLIALAMLTLTGLGILFVFKSKRRLTPALRTTPPAKTIAANASYPENPPSAKNGTEENPVRTVSESDPFTPAKNHTDKTARQRPTLPDKKEPEAPLRDGYGDTEELTDLMPEQATAQPSLEDAIPKLPNSEQSSVSITPAGHAEADPSKDEDDKTTLRLIDK